MLALLDPGDLSDDDKLRVALYNAGKLDEDCGDLEGDEIEIDISKPEMGMEVHVQDLSDLTPDEAFGAGWAAAAQAIEDALATGPEEAVEAGDEMGEEEEEELMEQYSDEQAAAAPRPSGPRPKSAPRPARDKARPASEDPSTKSHAGDDWETRKQKKMAPGQTGDASTPSTEPGDLFKKTINLDEAKKAAKQVFIKLLKEKRRALNENSVNQKGSTIVPGGVGKDGLPHEGTWARKQFTAGKRWKFTPEDLEALGRAGESDPPETKRQKKKRYNKPPRKTGSGSRQIDRARQVGISESLSIEEAKKIAKNIFIRFLNEEEKDVEDVEDVGLLGVLKKNPETAEKIRRVGHRAPSRAGHIRQHAQARAAR
jgi:hypothetical protein